MKIQTLTLAMACAGILTLGFLVWKKESSQRQIKEDLIELSKVKYGLFNVDEWKAILAEIISKKIDEYNLDDVNREEMEKRISEFLYRAINEFEDNFKSTNRRKSFLGISYQNAIANSVSLFSRLRDNVPQMTQQVLDYLEDPENRKNLKQYIQRKIEAYADATFAEVDYSEVQAILASHEYESRSEALEGLSLALEESKKDRLLHYLLFALILGLSAGLLVLKDLTPADITLLVVSAFFTLLLGLSLPMIDIDARISELSFSLLGEPVIFTDQVLYFKSKSILEVVWLMLSQGEFDLAAVGLLVLLFSVLFPMSKLICTLLYTYSENLRDMSWINWLVFKTGKWSMADVMVVTIFMAYIGFSGILTEQLKQLEGISQQLDILTTNQSTLQAGFYFFTCFVILSLLISQRISAKEETA